MINKQKKPYTILIEVITNIFGIKWYVVKFECHFLFLEVLCKCAITKKGKNLRIKKKHIAWNKRKLILYFAIVLAKQVAVCILKNT